MSQESFLQSSSAPQQQQHSPTATTQHVARAMGRERMATSLGTMVTHMQQTTNGGWKATSPGTRTTTCSGQPVANGQLAIGGYELLHRLLQTNLPLSLSRRQAGCFWG